MDDAFRKRSVETYEAYYKSWARTQMWARSRTPEDHAFGVSSDDHDFLQEHFHYEACPVAGLLGMALQQTGGE